VQPFRRAHRLSYNHSQVLKVRPRPVAVPPQAQQQPVAQPKPAAVKAAAPPVRDGAAFVQATLLDIRARVARGEKPRAVFDIDDTLADTRARTLALAKQWDQQNHTHHFDRLTLAQVAHNGFDTAAAMQLPGPAEQAFSQWWETAFWDGANFHLDAPIPSMVELVKQAKAAGAEIVYLTGRIADRRDATADELERFGLPDAGNVCCKPDLTVRTIPFKADWLAQSERDGRHVAFFATESRKDVAGLQKLGDCQCLLLQNHFSGGDNGVREDTPVIGRAL
jgi:phosphoglycolate phosphatase-like HAD superfamily hydrolase